MKKVLLIVAALFVGLQAQAQLQADGGYQHFFEHSVYSHGGLRDVSNAGWDGFYLGARYNIGLGSLVDGLSVYPGLNLSLMFSKIEQWDNASCRELALNLPVDVAYLFNFGVVQLRAFAGPAVQVGLDNRLVIRGGNSTHNFDMYASNDMYSAPRGRINVSMGAGVGAVVSDHFTAHVRFDFGLVNLSTAQYTKLHRHTLQIGLGYIF